jgi:hypothetical protein
LLMASLWGNGEMDSVIASSLAPVTPCAVLAFGVRLVSYGK